MKAAADAVRGVGWLFVSFGRNVTCQSLR
jgi:hypothetical protein